MKSIAVIGQGFVGSALSTIFTEKGAAVYTCDKNGKYTHGSIAVSPLVSDLIKACEALKDFSRIYFICVPTPMEQDGAADITIVENILEQLASVPGTRTAVVKSTVPPGSVEMWTKRYENLQIVFSPEFLTQANSLNDARAQQFIILGGNHEAVNVVRNVYRTYFPDVHVLKASSSTVAEMVKYFINIQLAVRVVLSCELSQVCEALTRAGMSVDYNEVVTLASHDARLGSSHMNVPGVDGIAGVRGACFPKDLSALIEVAKLLNVKPALMKAAWEKNLEVVKPKDRTWDIM